MRHLSNCAPKRLRAQVMKLRGPFVRWAREAGLLDCFTRDDWALDEPRLAAALADAEGGARRVLCLSTFTRPEAFGARPIEDYLAAAREMSADPGLRALMRVTALSGADEFFRGVSAARGDLLCRLGARYLADAIMCEMRARRREDAWRREVTDALRALCGFVGATPARRDAMELEPGQADGARAAVGRLRAMDVEVIEDV